jgi:L-malate glycosyltransferase
MAEFLSGLPRRSGSFHLLVVQRRLTHYRVPFFDALKHALASHGVELTLVVGDPTAQERSKKDEGQLKWAQYEPCRYYIGGRLCRQNLSRWLTRADAVVVTQENRMLNNFPLLLGRPDQRVALWGHGTNLQASSSLPSRAAQAVKRGLSRRADWWFAYTDLSAQLVREIGYPAERITSLNNAIDTRSLQRQLDLARAWDRATLRRQLGVADAPLGVFVGSLYADKRLDLLVQGALRIREQCPSFQVAVIGSGPMFEELREQTRRMPWFRVLGAVHGEHKARWLACADMLLNPGLVGLGILDSFVAELPMITTDCGLHSPEIAYLDHGVNGLKTQPTPEAFASGVLGILNDRELAAGLQQGCAASSHKYTLDAMVARFSEGVQRWRAAPLLRSGASGRFVRTTA